MPLEASYFYLLVLLLLLLEVLLCYRLMGLLCLIVLLEESYNSLSTTCPDLEDFYDL